MSLAWFELSSIVRAVRRKVVSRLRFCRADFQLTSLTHDELDTYISLFFRD